MVFPHFPTASVGSTGHPDKWYLPFVLRYAHLVEEGDHHPIATIAREEGEPERYIREIISRSRSRRGGRGLLTLAPRAGVAGGELTDKARALAKTLQGAPPRSI